MHIFKGYSILIGLSLFCCMEKVAYLCATMQLCSRAPATVKKVLHRIKLIWFHATFFSGRFCCIAQKRYLAPRCNFTRACNAAMLHCMRMKKIASWPRSLTMSCFRKLLKMFCNNSCSRNFLTKSVFKFDEKQLWMSSISVKLQAYRTLKKWTTPSQVFFSCFQHTFRTHILQNFFKWLHLVF